MTTAKTITDSDRIESVQTALTEDIRSGDITAELIAKEVFASATIFTREPMILCGQAWVDEVYQQLGTEAASVSIDWCANDGDRLQANQAIAHLAGPARTLLTGERSALNFLQTLSGTATRCREYADIVTGTQVKLLDTRKTIPGLRTAQKYAVTCGGCHNHRVGLYDAFLIKENHIMASGSITTAVTKARALQPNTLIEVEVENQTQLQEALQAHCDIIMLDNFSLSDIRQAVATAQGRTKLEISGNVELSGLRDYAETGVDYISIGGLTKHLSAIDLSMRFHLENP